MTIQDVAVRTFSDPCHRQCAVEGIGSQETLEEDPLRRPDVDSSHPSISQLIKSERGAKVHGMYPLDLFPVFMLS